MTERHLGASRIAGPDACRRVLLVGELNPYGADPDYALYYEPPVSAGGRLQRLVLGLPARHWYLPIWRVNLCTGDWDRDAALVAARDLTGPSVPWSTLILLGQKVRSAFPSMQPDMFAALTDGGSDMPTRTIVCLPHPSGRNPIWTDRANVERARSLLRKIIPEIPWGSLDEEKSA